MATVAPIEDTTIVGDNEDQLVTMIVDNQLFGIPILQVQDIVEASKITPVPLAPSAIAGVLNLRGRIVTVIDLRKLLGNHEEVPWNSQMGVTIEYKGDLYTLLVDAIGDVRTLPKRDFDGSPSTMEDNVRKLCSGIYRLRGNLLVVLDVSRILHEDVIDATPMLTVEERRTRKDAALAAAQSADGGESQQLSALMTDLNTYESETEGVFGAGMEESDDDIKARKRANRDRRPVGERWQEVLEDKARKSGQVSYRMREPDEETVETAREDAASEDEEWASRVMDPETAVPGPDGDAPQLESLAGDAAPDLPEPAAWDDDGLDPVTGDMPAMPETEPDAPVEDAMTDIPAPFETDIASDMPLEDLPPEEPQAEEVPVEATPVEDAPVEEAPVEDMLFEQAPVEDAPVEEAPVEDALIEEPPVEDTLFEDTLVEESPVEEAKTEDLDPFAMDTAMDMPVEDTAMDMPVEDTAMNVPVEEAKVDSPESGDSAGDSGATASGWWNKLRGKKSDDEDGDDSKDGEKKAKAKKAKAKKAKSDSKADKKAKADAKSKKKK